MKKWHKFSINGTLVRYVTKRQINKQTTKKKKQKQKQIQKQKPDWIDKG